MIEAAAPRHRRKVGRILPLQRIALALRPVDLASQVAFAPADGPRLDESAHLGLPQLLAFEAPRGVGAAGLEFRASAPPLLHFLAFLGLLLIRPRWLLIRRARVEFLRPGPRRQP